MRVFLAGATGAIGRRLVPKLVAAGHEVTAMTRSPERATQLEGQGAHGFVCDVFDADGLTRAMHGARPDAVVHQLTDIPRSVDPRRFAEQFRSTDRLRTEGTANLLAAARRSEAKRFLAQSVAFAHEPAGSMVKREDDGLWTNAPDWAAPMRAVVDLERQVREATDVEALSLRYGYFYGPGTAYAADGTLAERVRKRLFPIPRGASGLWSFVHVDDAADATVAALDHGEPGAFNVCDDEPATVEAWLPVFAEALGAPRPMRAPRFMVRLAAGPYGEHVFYGQRGASNEKARRELGWTPRAPSWREGFQAGSGDEERPAARA
jgi:2-alkyl-3-oxoalkanoate reductase